VSHIAKAPVRVFPSHSLFTGIRFTRYDALQHYTMMLSVGGRMVNSLNAVGHGPDDKTDILGANFSRSRKQNASILRKPLVPYHWVVY
jgi:hypothetical protein